MKTQTFGILAFTAPEPRIRYWVVRRQQQSRQAYGGKRENGCDKDNPDSTFPQSGKYTWTKGERRYDGCVYGVKESDGKYHYELRYDGGQGDEEWMKERDRNYLARLYLA